MNETRVEEQTSSLRRVPLISVSSQTLIAYVCAYDIQEENTKIWVNTGNAWCLMTLCVFMRVGTRM